MTQGIKEAYENIVPKTECASKKYFLLSPQCFLSNQEQILLSMPLLSSVNTFISDQFKILLFGKKQSKLLFYPSVALVKF